MDELTNLIMSICDCPSCYNNEPCERVLKVADKIRRIKIKVLQTEQVKTNAIAENTGPQNRGVYPKR